MKSSFRPNRIRTITSVLLVCLVLLSFGQQIRALYAADETLDAPVQVFLPLVANSQTGTGPTVTPTSEIDPLTETPTATSTTVNQPPTVTPTPTATSVIGQPPPDSPPPAHAGNAPSSLFDDSKFIYEGNPPQQSAVQPGAIDPRRVVVLRGRVLDHARQPIAGVSVRLLDHPAFGQSSTRADGSFDFVANGGAPITLVFEKSGFLPIQRTVNPAWQNYEIVDIVVLTPLDTQVTTVTFASNAAFQVARGTVQSDDDGTRQATLLTSAGITAEMVLADGSIVPLASGAIRATEYTVGDVGAWAMPGSLPPNSGFTYAVEFSVDEALAANASEVRFSKPLINYTENFIGAPVGSAVPTGYYDRQQARWIPSDNGRVIKIIALNGGLAEIDVTGDGVAETGEPLSKLGISDAERQQVAQLYTAGTELWRIEIPHFTPWDHNWPFGPPEGAEAPKLKEFVWKDPNDPCRQAGSIISCETQTLGQQVGIAGSPFSLVYQSDRSEGWTSADTLDIPITGAKLPPDLNAIQLLIDIAGTRYDERWCDPAIKGAETCDGLPNVGPNLTYKFRWNGLDGYNRKVYGRPTVTIRVTYIYFMRYYPASADFERSFAQIPTDTETFDGRASCGNAFRGVPTDMRWIQKQHFFCGTGMAQTIVRRIGAWPAKEIVQLGGWTIDAHYTYDPREKVIYLGDGSTQSVDGYGSVVTNVAGNPNGKGFPAAEGGAAVDADIDYLGDIAIAGDGTLYAYSGLNRNHIIKVRDGIVTTFAGKDKAKIDPSGDHGPALQADLGREIYGLATGPDDSLYFLATGNNYPAAFIRKITPDGIISTIAGINDRNGPGTLGDGGLAKNAKLTAPIDLLVGPDGTIYLGERASGVNNYKQRIRKIDPAGIITTIAGGGNIPMTTAGLGSGKPALEVNLGLPYGLALGADGSLYIAHPLERVVTRLAPNGILSIFAGNGQGGWSGEFGPAMQAAIAEPVNVTMGNDGSLFIYSFVAGRGSRILRVWPEGTIEVVAGVGSCSFAPRLDGEQARQACIGNHSRGLEIGADGALYYGDARYWIRRVGLGAAGMDAFNTLHPSADGALVYEFDPRGRHLRTLNGLTGATLLRFAYDAAGRLTAIVDADNNFTSIERAADGSPTAFVASGGQRTTVTLAPNGYIGSITKPGNRSTSFVYTEKGLMTTYTDPANQSSTYAYDGVGRLLQANRPNGEVKSFARQEFPTGVVVTMTTKMGLQTVYTLDSLPSGERRRMVRSPDGTALVMLVNLDGSRTSIAPNGTQITLTAAPDPRWGMRVPYAASYQMLTPAGKLSEVKTTKQVELTDRNNPFSIKSMTTRVAVNGSTSTTTYDGTTRTATDESAMGRETVTVYDARGRVVQVKPTRADSSEVAPILTTYDNRGHVVRVQHGDQMSINEYDGGNRLVKVSDASGAAIEYSYDAADRMVAVKMPGDRLYQYGYDAAGEMATVTMPNGTVYGYGYTAVGEENSFVVASDAAHTQNFTLDGEWTGETLPSGATRGFGFDAQGRLVSSTSVDSTGAMTYDAIGRMNSMSRTPNVGEASAMSLSFDGTVLTDMTVTGPNASSMVYTQGVNILPSELAFSSGGDNLTFGYKWDRDGMLSEFGSFQFSRDYNTGVVERINDKQGKLYSQFEYDDQLVLKQRRDLVNSQDVYFYQVERDATGRIIQKTEKLGDTTIAYVYSYDASNRLIKVERDGAVVETYTYDANGNRSSRQSNGSTLETASYDAQDKLINRNNVAYSFNLNGQLTQRGNDSFVYSVRGELLKVTLGDGTTLTYAYDAMNRRIARSSPQGTRRYYYGQGIASTQVTAVRDEAGVLSALFYNEQGYLIAIERAGVRFYVSSDQVGTPRVVADANGAVVKLVNYDSFGVILSDSNPAFDLPIGYAGGLADSSSGLLNFNWRDYEPISGRWTARDPSRFAGSPFNLYAYAANSPVTLRDPSGLSEIGFGMYAGVGGGVSLQWEWDWAEFRPKPDFAVCAEGGVGVGGGAEFDFNQDVVKKSNARLIGEVTGSAGIAGAGLTFELDLECMNAVGKGNIGAGPYRYEVDTTGSDTHKGGFQPEWQEKAIDGILDRKEMKIGKVKVGVEGKLVLKGCKRMTMPF